jgi:hypothetical protein
VRSMCLTFSGTHQGPWIKFGWRCQGHRYAVVLLVAQRVLYGGISLRLEVNGMFFTVGGYCLTASFPSPGMITDWFHLDKSHAATYVACIHYIKHWCEWSLVCVHKFRISVGLLDVK